jgi:hypothetical protein
MKVECINNNNGCIGLLLHKTYEVQSIVGGTYVLYECTGYWDIGLFEVIPFKVKCIDSSSSGGMLTYGSDYTVVDVTSGIGEYQLLGICDSWMPSRFLEIKEVPELILEPAKLNKKQYNPNDECACRIGIKNFQCDYHKES